MRLVTGTAAIDDPDRFLADLDAIGEAHDCTVQAFDPRYVADRAHLERAVELADRAIDRGENVARDRAVEILLYAAGRRQIDDALEMGVDPGEGPVAVVVAADPGIDDPDQREAGAADAVRDLLDPGEVEFGDDELLRAFFGIGEAELGATTAALPALVRERVALLDVEK